MWLSVCQYVCECVSCGVKLCDGCNCVSLSMAALLEDEVLLTVSQNTDYFSCFLNVNFKNTLVH